VVIYREIGTDRIFKYVGSSAAIAYDNEGNYVRMSEIKSMRIKGTIEHSNYKGKDETKIKRVKILSFERQ
jgi:hypothetical protein